VVKPGYLENSRVVGLSSGVAKNLSVELTPDASYSTTSAVQVEDYEPEPEEAEEEGGSNKLLFVRLGAVAMGAGAFLLVRNTNEPPTAGSVIASPGVGLAAITNISFSATGARPYLTAFVPDGDSLTYTWDFGDGATTTTSGQFASHTYGSAGSYRATVTVSDGVEQAWASGNVTIRDLTGRWDLTWAGSSDNIFDLTQNGTAVTGRWTCCGGAGSSVAGGTIRAPSDLVVRFTNSLNGDTFQFTGTGDAGFNVFSGTLRGVEGNTWSAPAAIRRQ
jgi:hypothetical protein